MADDRVYFFDTTLRDGAQTQGIDFNPVDKEFIARELDRVGIDYIEGGWPGANPTDDAFFSNLPPLKRSKLVAFGMTRRPGRSTENDPGLAALISAGTHSVCMVGKSWDLHVDIALETNLDENVSMISDSVRYAAGKLDEVIFDAEHFFDGYKSNPEFALRCIKAAYDAGARWVVLCDTNGGTLPHEIEEIVAEVCKRMPNKHIGIHSHDDTGNAVANSLAAVRAGAR
ncbi:MAG: citramalate synthase, partial [Pseudomonadota bacterium]|nr:citramalate synthase [Pseudomonadota bacterium]